MLYFNHKNYIIIVNLYKIQNTEVNKTYKNRNNVQ